MKKKIGALLLCGMLSFTAIGCSGEKETASLSAEMKELGIAAVETADDFLDGNITGDAAMERLENNHSIAKMHYERELEEDGSDTLSGTGYWEDISIPVYISSLEISIRKKDNGTGTDEKILEDRNKLAEIVDKKER